MKKPEFSHQHPQSNDRGDQSTKNTKETKEKEPKIIYNVLFAPHGTVEDFSKLEENFKQCDIYIPELYGWTQSVLDRYNQVSQGDISPKKARLYSKFPGILDKVLSVIYRSKKPIISIDVSAKEKAEKEKKQPVIDLLLPPSDRAYVLAMDNFLKGRLEVAINAMRSYINLSVKYIDRETTMKKMLAKKIKEAIENNPKLKNKPEIKVLISLGSMHTSFYHWLKKQHPTAHYKFNKSPYIYTVLDEAERRKLFKKGPISDLLIAKSMTERKLRSYLKNFSDDNAKIYQITRQMVSHLDLSDIEQIISKGKGREQKIQKNIIARLKEKGIFVPTSKAELDKLTFDRHRCKLIEKA